MTINPIGDKVLIKQVDRQATSRIICPEKSKKIMPVGIVIAAGKANSNLIGQCVVFNFREGAQIELLSKKQIVWAVKQDSLLAVLEG